MIKTIQFLMAVLLVSFSATAFAQCIPMNAPGPPRHWDGVRGCYVPQGTPSVQQYGNNSGGQRIVYGGQNVGYSNGQQVYNGQQIAQVAQGLGSGLSKCEVMGGVAGGTLGSLAANNTPQATILGAILGGVVGNAVCQNNQGERVLVQSNGQGQITQRVLQQGGQSRPPGHCFFEGDDLGAMSESSCNKVINRLRAAR